MHLKNRQHRRLPLQPLKPHDQGIIYRYSFLHIFSRKLNMKFWRKFLKNRTKSSWNTQSCEKLKIGSYKALMNLQYRNPSLNSKKCRYPNTLDINFSTLLLCTVDVNYLEMRLWKFVERFMLSTHSMHTF